MSTIETITQAIQRLSPEELAGLRAWFARYQGAAGASPEAPARVTEMLDRTLAELDEPANVFTRLASRHVLERTEW